MRWTPAEDEYIRRVFASVNSRLCYLCAKLGRSPMAICIRAIRIGVWRST